MTPLGISLIVISVVIFIGAVVIIACYIVYEHNRKYLVKATGGQIPQDTASAYAKRAEEDRKALKQQKEAEKEQSLLAKAGLNQ